jgi:hypothetical protein
VFIILKNVLDRRSIDRENRDPGVNSDDEGDDMFKVVKNK